MNEKPLPTEFVTAESLPWLLGVVEMEARPEWDFHSQVIGKSREDRDIIGVRIGKGPRHVSITAGAHSDEPAGPMAAMALLNWLAMSELAAPFLEAHTFYICPQINPDGAHVNSRWFRDELDPLEYIEHVMREEPGDDIEFGYPVGQDGVSSPPVRSENAAVAAFLGEAGPFVFHASLHGMAYSEGAWYLICKEWVDRSSPLRETLKQKTAEEGLPLHDIDRHGDKGFTRIEEGFCTTPTSVAMKEHFLKANNPAMAELFRPSSMEYVQSLGGDPLLMVSEMPLFLLSPRHTTRSNPPGEHTPYTQFRSSLPEVKVAAGRGDLAPLQALLEEYQVEPVPFAKQVRLINAMILEALRFLTNGNPVA